VRLVSPEQTFCWARSVSPAVLLPLLQRLPQDWFREAGKVVRAHISLNPAQQSRGYGIVLYEQPGQAKRAIRMFNESIWNGRKLKVREDRKPQGSSNTTTFPFPTSLDHSSSHAKPSLTPNNNHSSTANTQPALSSFASSPGASTPIAPSSAHPLSSSISVVASTEMLPRSAHTTNPSSSSNSLANLVQSSSSSHLIQPTMPPAQPPQMAAAGGSGSGGNSASLTPGLSQQQLFATNAPHPASQCKVFINNLPFHVDWNDVKTLFSQAGTVVHAFVAYHNDTRSKGYGSVQFATAEEAANAIRMFNHQQWEGRILHVREDRGFGNNAQQPPPPHTPQPIVTSHEYDMQKRRLFISNIPFECVWQEIKDLFRMAGTVIRVDIVRHADVGGPNIACA
jgi:RNA recognition motif-containing protein